MRRKRDTQGWLDFQPSTLKLTNEYFAKYEAISAWLDETPRILDLVHADTKDVLSSVNDGQRRRRGHFRFTSEHVLRICICQIVEGESLRGITVRVDTCSCLRRFTRLYDGPMMDYTTFDRLRNAIRPETWKEINRILAHTAVEQDVLSGDELRLDTTAVETNIHYPMDSSLLWDSYRTLGRRIEVARAVDSDAVGTGRIHLRRVRGYHRRISRLSVRKNRRPADLEEAYSALIRSVEGICEWADDLAGKLTRRAKAGRYGVRRRRIAKRLAVELKRYVPLGRRVAWQASERVLEGRPVPNDAKLLSIFEPHTELIKRGKAGKLFEYGHMVQIQQVRGCFITDYEVFSRKPNESHLLPAAIESHKRLFGSAPSRVTADKGYWPGSETLAELEREVDMVAVGKKGRSSAQDARRESDPLFRHAQRFRTGVEGTISFLKRVLGLARCFNRGWRNYVSTVGSTVFVHNLLVLARC